MDINLLFIIVNILALINDISCITTNCNCSYQHVSLFNEFVDKFGTLNKDCWIGMFNVERVIKPSILNAHLLVDAISKTLVFVKLENMSLL
jgi:hypothetical protein